MESVTEPEDNAGGAEEGGGEEAGKETAGEDDSGNENPDEGQNTPAGEDSFEGVVREINEKDNFVVVSKIFTEEVDGGMVAAEVIAIDGSEDEELITVYFT